MNRGKRLMVAGLALMILGGGLLALARVGSNAASHAHSTSSSTYTPPYRSVAPAQAGADAVLFFWYGCPHCLKLEEEFRQIDFSGTASSSVTPAGHTAIFTRVPAVLDSSWELDARVYYSLQQLGFSEAGHYRVMKRYVKDRPTDLESLKELLMSGVLEKERETNPLFRSTADQVISQLYTPAIDTKISESRKLTQAIGLEGVPSILVGKDKLLELGGGLGYHDLMMSALSLLRGGNGSE
jgi:thiol:disulfide interchange protein DsbA